MHRTAEGFFLGNNNFYPECIVLFYCCNEKNRMLLSERGCAQYTCLAQGSLLGCGIEVGESAGYSLSPPTIPAGPETGTHGL